VTPSHQIVAAPARARRYLALFSGAVVIGLLAPGIASALPAVSVSVVTDPLTNTTAHTGVTVTAACPSGTLVGGGSYLRNATDPSSLPTNGLVLGGQAPSTGASPVDVGVANGATDPSHWFTDANFTGVADPANVDQAEGFALCATGGTAHTVVATASTSGATDNANQQVSPPVPATATCPAGDQLIGGGATTTTPDQVNDGTTVGNSGNLKPLASYPSDASGGPAASGSTTVTSWSAYGSAGIQNGGGGPDVVTAYALCSTDPTAPPVEVARVDVNGPVAQLGTTTTTGSATCPSGTQLIGGGYGADETAGSISGLQPQQGYHMRGSYPSTGPASSAGGTPPGEVADGAGNPEIWTAVLQLGGQALPAGDFGTLHVYAMCAMAPASPTSADLEVSLSGAPDSVVVGQPLTYTIGVANGGPAAATGVLATETLPATVTFVSATSTAGSCAQASGTLTCTISALASGASATITVVVTPTQPGALDATATVSGDQPDDNPGNNSAAVTTMAKLPTVPVLNQPTLTVTAAGASAPTVGGSITGEATLAGGTVITGRITLTVYGPGDTSCSHALATTTAAVSGNGIYGSRPFVATAPGTYRWVASYGGDALNGPAGPTPCGGAPITVTASAHTPVNKFGLRLTTKSGRIILHLTSPGRGTFRAVAKARASAGGKGKASTARYGSGSLRVGRAGHFTLTIAPGPAGKALRRHHRHLSVTVAVTFTPAGGKPSTKNAHLSVPGSKPIVTRAAATLAGATAPSTYVVSGSAAGPSSTFSEVTALADCAGTPLSGGGARLAQTTPTVTHNGIHIDGSFPTPDGTSQAANGDLTPTRWIAAGGSGGAVPNDAQTLAYGVCLQAGPTVTMVAVASTPGPTQTFQMVRATATCPAGTQLLSGGARTTPGTIGSLKPNGSFPSHAMGRPILTGVNPQSWTVEGLNGGGGDQSNTTYAFAVCATGDPGLTVTVVHTEVSGPALASTATQTTATCPANTALLGGGGFISDAFGLPGSQGDHLTGSYPSDATGTPVASGQAASWTAASHTGGADSGSLTQTDVWAMCGSSAAGPPPATGPAAPVNSRAPRVAGTLAVGRVLRAVHGSWSGRPTRVSDQWLRCSFSGSTCASIAGAIRQFYAPTNADIGSRLRVRETARNPAGTSTPAVSPPTSPVRARRVTAAEITALLARQIVPTGAATKIPTMLVRGYTALPFTALERGRGTVDWYVRDAGGREVLAAQGTEGFPGARATTIDVHLTTAGNTALNAVRTTRVTARGTFVPAGKPALTVSRTFLLTRDASARAIVLPVSFEPNLGQAGPVVGFLAHGPGGAVELTTSGAMMAPGGLTMKLAGGRRDPRVSVARLLPGTSNYLLGPRRDWRTGVRGYRQVVFHSVYPGIDLRYDGGRSVLEYDFELAPGADPRRIAVELAGAKRLRIDRAGNLLAGGKLIERAPSIYQVAGGVRRRVRGGFVLRGPRRFAFAVGSYHHARKLVIDPRIVFSSEFVGSPPGEGEGIAVDRAGDTFVTGETSSANFPVASALQAQPRGVTENAFVAKLDPAGALVYATYLGGGRFTDGRGIAVDAAGNAYVTGATNSTDFPTTRSAFQRSYGGGPFDAFVTKLDPRGSGLVYSTLLGDTHYDEGNAIAVDPRGQAVITGKTASPNFPLVRPLAPHTTSGAFVTKLNWAGTGIASSTVFGGHGPMNHADAGFGIAVDPQDDTYVTGETNDPGFPTMSALQPQLAGAGNAFVIKINPASTKVIYSTYLGGSGNDIGRAIAADANGNSYVTGQTTSPNFPTAKALEPTNPSRGPAAASAFVTKLSPTGNALVYSTYLGGSGGPDSAFGIAIDRAGDAYVTGQTSAPDFPLARPLQRAPRGPTDAFVTELGVSGSALAFSTYYGGTGADAGLAIALDRGGGVHITGTTDSTDFPRRGARGRPKRYPTPGTGAFVASIRVT
jgi:uncharacterized repeat protein (TIGR01451 family)